LEGGITPGLDYPVFETDFGKAGQFQTLWSSMEELLVSYNDKPFVSETYRSALDGVGGRAERMATVELPPDLPEWMASLADNVRRSRSDADRSVHAERDARAGEIAADLEALAEDCRQLTTIRGGDHCPGDGQTRHVSAGRGRMALDGFGNRRARDGAIGDIDETDGWPFAPARAVGAPCWRR
jgi:hypothetical protein